MPYADAAFYKEIYVGTEIADDDFLQLSERASAFIDQVTFQRAAAETDAAKIVLIKKAMCAVAEEIQRIENAGGVDGIVAESIGSAAVTYSRSSIKQQTKEQRYAAAAKRFLGSSGLMFRGFKSGEMGGVISG